MKLNIYSVKITKLNKKKQELTNATKRHKQYFRRFITGLKKL